MIEVSVVICALNEERRIGRQLAALDAQIDAPPFEVIVVDNGSTDGTVATVQEWIRSSPHVAVGVRVVDASSAPGIPAARNAGARAADGRVLAYCDADDEVQPGWVAAIAHGVKGTSLAGGRLIAFEPDGTCRGDLFSGPVTTSYLPHIGGANFALERKTYFEVGGFDESLPRYGFDDVDFSWRMQEAGHQIVYLPDAVVHFSLSGARASVRKRFQLGKGRVLMAKRFPRYDPADYTLRSTARDVGRTGSRLLRTLIMQRRLDTRLASQAVSAVGRAVGAVVYRDGALPPRRLLDTRSEPK
ncbi:glycosyltransferase [Brachybacterium sp. p3-SID1565]|uniref:glycosyltransferase family 2 protein n=1 Tax=Brachybacterium sp. p3-SID1565 TaxID=2916046 RepID=UPI0021A953A3|nr:glycosyltransferase [Brachybacterium sp. p3-SID1565]MCT1385966.1 glycosyltransferase [Brachybacterium sp. p3-SID1565]